MSYTIKIGITESSEDLLKNRYLLKTSHLETVPTSFRFVTYWMIRRMYIVYFGMFIVVI